MSKKNKQTEKNMPFITVSYKFTYRGLLAVTLKMTNQDRMIFGDLSANSQPIFLKFRKGHFLFKS